MSNDMISIICPFTDKNMLETYLLNSLKKQTYQNYELVLIDSNKMSFDSASSALNYAVNIAKGNILIFSHQDVEITDVDALKRISAFCSNNDFGIAGVAGVSTEYNKVYSSALQGKNHSQVGEKLTRILEAYSVDECFFIIKREKFFGFCDLGQTWHFYAVEYSLRCIENKDGVYLLPIDIYHLSPGWSLNDSYWTTLLKVAKIHSSIKVIYTTMGFYHNNCLLFLYTTYKRLKQYIKKKYKTLKRL